MKHDDGDNNDIATTMMCARAKRTQSAAHRVAHLQKWKNQMNNEYITCGPKVHVVHS